MNVDRSPFKVDTSGRHRLNAQAFGVDDDRYAVAIQILSPDEQLKVLMARDAGKKEIGWFKSFFWAPLKLNDGTVVLVNLNSAKKRLRISKEQVVNSLSKKALGNQQFVELIQRQDLENQIAGCLPHSTRKSAVVKFLSNEIQKLTTQGKEQALTLIKTGAKAYDWETQWQASSQKLMGLIRDDLKKTMLINKLGNKLNDEQISKIIKFVNKNPQFTKQVQLSSGPLLIERKQYPSEIDRSIEYHEGHVYILLNRVKAGDPLLGEGTYKKAKLAVDMDTGEVYVRLMQKISWTDPLARHKIQGATSEFQTTVQEIGKHEGIAETISVRALNVTGPEIKKFAFMQSYYNGGTLKDALKTDSQFPLTIEEKLLIAEKIVTGLNWLHKTKNMIHRDIKPANIWLKRNPDTGKITDAVLGDFGFTCSLNNERWQDAQKRKRLAGTPLFMPYELVQDFALPEGTRNTKRIEVANSFSLDQWAMGMTLYHLFKDDIPEWRDENNQPFILPWLGAESKEELLEFLEAYTLGDGSYLPEPKSPDSIGHVIRGLLHPNPKQRMDINTVLMRIKAIKDTHSV